MQIIALPALLPGMSAWTVLDADGGSLGYVRTDPESPVQPSYVAGTGRYLEGRSGFESVESAAAWLEDPTVVPVPDWLDRLPGAWSQTRTRRTRRAADGLDP